MNILPLIKSVTLACMVSFFLILLSKGSIAAGSSGAVKPLDPAKLNQCTMQNQQANRDCGNKTDANQKDQCLKVATEKYRVCLEKP